MLAANEHEGYLFLSLLQARVGGSVMRRVPEGDAGSLLGRPAFELAREMGLGEKASRALAELIEGFDAAGMLGVWPGRGFGRSPMPRRRTPRVSGSRRILHPRCSSVGSSGMGPRWRSWGLARRRGRGWRRPRSSGGRSPRGGWAW